MRFEEAARPATCRALIDGFEQAVSMPVTWHELDDRVGRLAMARSCISVGPAVYGAPPHVDGTRHVPIDRLVVLSWNVHVGGGDLVALVDDIRSGRLTGGEPVRDFVVLLQEAFRSGTAIPDQAPHGVPIPRRIEEFPPKGPRQDIVEAAQALGLGVFYVPSMRNGAAKGSSAEDRGNAILSTLPLSTLTGIELPFERQRRIAASATVTGVDEAGNRWQVRVVSAHLNATASARRLWMFSAGLRARQARHLAGVLANGDVPTVVGSDLNAWAGGASEPACSELRAHFPQTPPPLGQPTFRGGRMLDYVFLRVPAAWSGQLSTIDDFFGSDHRPLIGWIQFRPDPRTPAIKLLGRSSTFRAADRLRSRIPPPSRKGLSAIVPQETYGR